MNLRVLEANDNFIMILKEVQGLLWILSIENSVAKKNGKICVAIIRHDHEPYSPLKIPVNLSQLIE